MSAYVPDSIGSKAGGLGALVLGSVALLIGLISLAKGMKLWFRGKRTTGTVADIEKENSTRGRVFYRPIVAFVSEDGTEHRWRRDVGENTPGYTIGQTVPILYDAANPGRAAIGTFAEVFGAAIAAGLLGAFFVGLGWALGPHDWAGIRAVLDYVFIGNLKALGLDRFIH